MFTQFLLIPLNSPTILKSKLLNLSTNHLPNPFTSHLLNQSTNLPLNLPIHPLQEHLFLYQLHLKLFTNQLHRRNLFISQLHEYLLLLLHPQQEHQFIHHQQLHLLINSLRMMAVMFMLFQPILWFFQKGHLSLSIMRLKEALTLILPH